MVECRENAGVLSLFCCYVTVSFPADCLTVFVWDNWFIFGRQLMVMDETHVVNQMKEDTCYVSADFWQDMETAK